MNPQTDKYIILKDNSGRKEKRISQKEKWNERIRKVVEPKNTAISVVDVLDDHFASQWPRRISSLSPFSSGLS